MKLYEEGATPTAQSGPYQLRGRDPEGVVDAKLREFFERARKAGEKVSSEGGNSGDLGNSIGKNFSDLDDREGVRFSVVDEPSFRSKEAEDDAIGKANERFNGELEKQIDGKLPKWHVYQLGKPGSKLLAAGFPNLPIELSASHLEGKARQSNHEFEVADMKGLVKALNDPVAVFAYGDKTKAQNAIVELERDDKNFIVGVHFNIEKNGIQINSIRGLFNKNNTEWLNWINQGKLLWVDKEKIQDVINKQRTNPADLTYLDLDSAAKVIENFENPKLPWEKVYDYPHYYPRLSSRLLFLSSKGREGRAASPRSSPVLP